MKTLDSDFILEKNKKENAPIFLYIIYDYDGNTDLYLAEYDSDVVFDGQTYTRFPITHNFISESSSGQISKVTISLCNVSRLIQGYLESYDFRGKKVLIRMVWANLLSDVSAKIDWTFYVDKYSADEKNVSFELSEKFDILDISLPYRLYNRNYCSWKFKSSECGYAGAETECNRTLQRCKELSNRVRFGGFPSIPAKRIFL